jgi:hypothetical protein
VHRSVLNLFLIVGLTIATVAAGLPVFYQASGFLGAL